MITLPDGKQKHYDKPVTVAQVAADIGAGLAKAAVAGKVNGKSVDTFFEIHEPSTVEILTPQSAEGLEVIRHSTAHLLAHAVKQLYPQAQVTIGPVIEDGFYYDFAYEPGFKPEDLEKIEARMQELAKANISVSRKVVSRAEAITFFENLGEAYKAEIIRDLPESEVLTLYTQGDFVDLCRGPHVPSTGYLKAFKLTKLAGAYWRGDSKNEMLQRVYGTAWADQKALQDYLTRLEEALKRDHRRLAKELNLFHTQEEAPGMVFWHPKGWVLYRVVESFIRQQAYEEGGYSEINTPMLLDKVLWEKSGHWEKYREDMFITNSENREFAIKPMSCPCHVQVFNQRLHSYRELPIRYAEFGTCHRNEASGTLHGLMRVRRMTQDDGHIFCRPDQIQEEVSQFVQTLFKIYRIFGFEDVIIRLSMRPDKRVGSDEVWDRAEQALAEALKILQLDYSPAPGDGAFYGPKIDFSLRDCIGRIWQCGTLQLDFSTPLRLDASYIAEDGSRQTPVMIHRAILGSLDRFIGILIENYAGKFPMWLAPVQIVVMSITDAQGEYANEVAKHLKKEGFRVTADIRNEKVNYKIREHSLQKIPYLLVVGGREMENRTVSVRTQGGEDLGIMTLDQLIKQLYTLQSGQIAT